jgi:two-component system phosphate regulon sensor histidine kinase PhoR
MFGSNLRARLPRKIAACFLVFGLTGLVWLGFGAGQMVRWVTDSRSESASLRWLGRGSDRAALAYVRGKNAGVQAAMIEIAAESGASYCAVVAPEGTYLAHSTATLVGSAATEREGATDRWGEIVRAEFLDDAGVLVHEYQAPLVASGKRVGSIRLGMAQPSVWSFLGAGAKYFPLALVGPACCVVAGAVLANRLVRPVADIEEQLTQVAMSPSVEGCTLSEVEGESAAARGWNRVVQKRLVGPSESLAERLRGSLEQGRQSRLEAVLNSIPEGVATTNAEGELTYTNLPMSVILGLKGPVGDDGAESGQKPLKMADVIVERWKIAPTDPLLANENRDRAVVAELEREEDGHRRISRAARHPISIGGSGKHETHVWTIRDVTQQKLAEEMRDQFVDTATHELRTPLANIKAYAETLALADMIDVEQQKQFLNTINSEATRLARFVDDLLSVSSMELGSLALNKQVTDLGRMLSEVLAKVQAQADEKGLTLEVVLPQKFPEPALDKDKVAGVLVNLLGNAVKYTPEGGRVVFRANFTDQQLELSVEDTGVGIAQEELPKVFDKFFRSDDPRVQEQTGTGLGLALAQEVVRLHGGRIEVESELDKGSTFTVILPLG